MGLGYKVGLRRHLSVTVFLFVFYYTCRHFFLTNYCYLIYNIDIISFQRGGEYKNMVQKRSEAYLRPICERPAILSLQAIIYHPKLHYSEKVLAIALLMEPGFSFPGGFQDIKLKRGLTAQLARKFGVPLSSISLWLKRLIEVGEFKRLELLQQGGASIPYISIK